MKRDRKPLVLTIMDGWGHREESEANAVALANTPVFDRLLQTYPHTLLHASGEDVGLPAGQMGNSEVGHLNIGAGRIVYQELTRISKEIKDKTFFMNEELNAAMDNVLDHDSSLHLLGLLSDGGVHSHIDHLFALLQMAKDKGLSKVYVHVFLDGRDVPPANALQYIEQLENECLRLGLGAIATVMGRYYGMDRDKRWDRTEKAFKAIVCGKGETALSAAEAVKQSYEAGATDEFVLPTVITDKHGKPTAVIKDDDAAVFFNFRPDRARQITRALVDDEFSGFERPDGRLNIYYVCMTQYDKTINAPVAFKPQQLNNTLGQVISQADLKQLRIAETEKYAHVTFFFNGGVEEPNKGEERLLINSPKVATYDLQPEMSAAEVTDALLGEIESDKHDVIIINYANADMVGHTGIEAAAIKAVETVDTCIGRLIDSVLKKGGEILITADHGNAEQMKDEHGDPHTAHTCNLVPFIYVSDNSGEYQLHPGRLEDIAPTMLYLLNIEQPEEMSGHCLLTKISK